MTACAMEGGCCGLHGAVLELIAFEYSEDRDAINLHVWQCPVSKQLFLQRTGELTQAFALIDEDAREVAACLCCSQMQPCQDGCGCKGASR